jgi:hypothetical protein
MCQGTDAIGVHFTLAQRKHTVSSGLYWVSRRERSMDDRPSHTAFAPFSIRGEKPERTALCVRRTLWFLRHSIQNACAKTTPVV